MCHKPHPYKTGNLIGRHAKSKDRPKVRPLVPKSHILNVKGNILKEIKNATSVYTQVIRKQDSLIAEMGKVLMIWLKFETSHITPLNQSLMHNRSLTVFNPMKARRGEQATEEKFGASRGWFRRFKKKAISITEKCKVGQQVQM